jgi:hypothetical protein
MVHEAIQKPPLSDRAFATELTMRDKLSGRISVPKAHGSFFGGRYDQMSGNWLNAMAK